MKRIVLGIVFSVLLMIMCAGCVSESEPEENATNEPEFKMNSALLADDGTIDVIWNRFSGADEFEVYRSDAKDGDYAKIGSAEGDATYYTDENVELHETYWYKVKYVKDGESSEFSDVVAAYVSDGDIRNDNMTFEVVFPEGDTHTGTAGDGAMGTNTYDTTITAKLNGAVIKDCTVYYDKSGLSMSPLESGGFEINIIKPGMHIITFVSGDEKGTFRYAAEKMVSGFDNDYFQLFWPPYNQEAGLNDIFYPEAVDTTLPIKHDGSDVSEIEAESSNADIAEVSVSGGEVAVHNNSPGICNISIKGADNKGEITWVVRRGKALDRPEMEDIVVDDGSGSDADSSSDSDSSGASDSGSDSDSGSGHTYGTTRGISNYDICYYIHGRYHDYARDGGYDGDDYTDDAWRDAEAHFGLSEAEIEQAWTDYDANMDSMKDYNGVVD